MVQMQTASKTEALVFAQTIDIEDFLELRHAARQSIQERKALEKALRDLSSRSDLQEAKLREAAVRWALGEDPSKTAIAGSKHPLALMIQARACRAAGQVEKELELCERAAKEAPTDIACAMGQISALRRLGRTGEALKRIEGLRREFSDHAEFAYQEGRCLEETGLYNKAAECYENAVTRDEEHYRAVFRIAYLNDLRGNDEESIKLYQKLSPGRNHAFIETALNLGLLYEDNGDYERAIACFREVIRRQPSNYRAKLFLKDAESSLNMYYSPEENKENERLDAILRVPVSDFELSVRSRNCLSKMNINSLGDLVRKTEAEMLSYKNFGETSLREIKDMLESRNLRLGMFRDDSPRRLGMPAAAKAKRPTSDGQSLLAKSIDELELSVRSRKCMERLGIVTVGDLANYSEADLVASKNFGRVSLQEVKIKLREIGLGLKNS